MWLLRVLWVLPLYHRRLWHVGGTSVCRCTDGARGAASSSAVACGHDVDTYAFPTPRYGRATGMRQAEALLVHYHEVARA